MVCKIIILCAVAENGENLVNGKFQWERKDQVQAGWMITDNWLKDATMPIKGFIAYTYKPTCDEKFWKENIYSLQRALLSAV